MSLQVWLPLNGDLHNQGLNFIQFATTYTENDFIQNNGKIGKCCFISGGGRAIYSTTDFSLSTQAFSGFLWVKFVDWLPSGTNGYILSLNNQTATDMQFMLGVYRSGSTGNAVWTFNGGSMGGKIEVNIWYHIGFTYDSQKLKIYCNGECIKEVAKTSAQSATHLIIGGRSNNADGNNFKGTCRACYNDVRIYDHCLSPKEVKEISKGLVLHLKLNSNDKIYDCSGYQNNGIIINSLTLDNTSPRYDNAIHFSATNQKIQISNLNVTGFGDSYTFSWWGKVSTYSNIMFWGFEDGIRLNGIVQTSEGMMWNTGDSSDNPLLIPDTSTKVTPLATNKWYHFAMVGNGNDNTCKVYIDGELYGVATTYKSISGTKIIINGWNMETNYSSNDMSISDFRFYATALDDNEIKKLYNTSGVIDNNGNLYTRELVE